MGHRMLFSHNEQLRMVLLVGMRCGRLFALVRQERSVQRSDTVIDHLSPHRWQEGIHDEPTRQIVPITLADICF